MFSDVSVEFESVGLGVGCSSSDHWLVYRWSVENLAAELVH